MDQRGRIATWLRATPIPVVDHKAPTVTTDDAPLTPGDQEEEQAYVVPEMGGSQVLEMEGMFFSHYLRPNLVYTDIYQQIHPDQSSFQAQVSSP